MWHRSSVLAIAVLAIAALAITMMWTGAVFAAPPSSGGRGQPSQQTSITGKELYQAACATCHGTDGRGAPRSTVGFEDPLPDFTDCRFASREADADWSVVTKHGGPARSFDRMMPAFDEALTDAQILSLVTYLHNFCRDSAWPHGDLNLPRPLVTEKAFPEDEAVLTMTVAAEGPGAVSNRFVYEWRFGARNQVELALPIIAQRPGGNGGWTGGFGDIALGYKRSLFHSLRTGSIFSVGGEAILPTGNRAMGTGKGATVFEPFLAFGQILPSDGFVHFQGGIELPTHGLEKEAFWRIAAGRSFAQGGFGRTWSPMIELLGARELGAGAGTEWDVVPQLQITLSKRQHVMMNVGARTPVNNTGRRSVEIMIYFLWDWFDGGLGEGW